MSPGEPSAAIRERVLKARQTQESRFQGQKCIHSNSQMTERMIHQYAEPDESSLELLRMAMERLKLSARAYNRILKVARTIADLEGCEGGGVTTLRKPSATAVWTVVTGLNVEIGAIDFLRDMAMLRVYYKPKGSRNKDFS